MKLRNVLLAAVAAALLPALAAAQDQPPGADPVAPLQDAARDAQGDARAPAFARLASALEAAGRWSEAAAAWRECAAAAPSAGAAAGEGRALLAFAEEVLAAGEPGSAVRGAFEDARSALRRARDLGAKDPAVRIGLARCLAAEGRTAEQIAELEAAAQEAPDSAAPRRALAFALYHAGRDADAVAALRPLSDADPADLNLSLTLSECARRLRDEALALAAAERTLEHHPEDPRAWKAVWAVYAGDRRWGELAARLDALSKARPGSKLGPHYAGFAHGSAQQWTDAVRCLGEAWERDPKNTTARLESARILLVHAKDRAAADRQVREVLAAEPGNRQAANLLSFVAQRRSEDGDHAGAVGDLEFLTERRPDDVVALSNLAVELKFSGRYDESAAAYRRALAASPGDPQVLNDLALTLVAAGRLAEARAAFLEGVAADPEGLDNLENLGWLSRHEGRTGEAIDWYTRASRAARSRGRSAEAAKFARTLDDLRFPLPPVRRSL